MLISARCCILFTGHLDVITCEQRLLTKSQLPAQWGTMSYFLKFTFKFYTFVMFLNQNLSFSLEQEEKIHLA